MLVTQASLSFTDAVTTFASGPADPGGPILEDETSPSEPPPDPDGNGIPGTADGDGDGVNEVPPKDPPAGPQPGDDQQGTLDGLIRLRDWYLKWANFIQDLIDILDEDRDGNPDDPNNPVTSDIAENNETHRRSTERSADDLS